MAEKLDLSKLFGQPKEYDINGVKMLLKPLTVKELPLLMKAGKEETQAEAMIDMFKKTVKNSYPDMTDEEINNLENVSVEHFTKLLEAVMDVNSLEIDRKKLETMVR